MAFSRLSACQSWTFLQLQQLGGLGPEFHMFFFKVAIGGIFHPKRWQEHGHLVGAHGGLQVSRGRKTCFPKRSGGLTNGSQSGSKDRFTKLFGCKGWGWMLIYRICGTDLYIKNEILHYLPMEQPDIQPGDVKGYLYISTSFHIFQWSRHFFSFGLATGSWMFYPRWSQLSGDEQTVCQCWRIWTSDGHESTFHIIIFHRIFILSSLSSS